MDGIRAAGERGASGLVSVRCASTIMDLVHLFYVCLKSCLENLSGYLILCERD